MYKQLSQHCRCGAMLTIDKKSDEPVSLLDNHIKYPDFMLFEDRIATFVTWPRYMGVTPRDLSEAGFVYSGSGDECFCFHCGIRAKHWKPWDDAKKEHLKHSPNCHYIRMIYSQPGGTFTQGYDEVDG